MCRYSKWGLAVHKRWYQMLLFPIYPLTLRTEPILSVTIFFGPEGPEGAGQYSFIS